MRARITVTIKLTEGKDDDLIAWWQSVPKGQRQVMVKAALRDYLQNMHQKADELAQIGADTAWLREAISEMPAYIERLLAGLAVVPAEPPTEARPARTGQLSTDGVARREKRIANAAW